MLVDLEEKPNRPSDFSPEECLRLLNANTRKSFMLRISSLLVDTRNNSIEMSLKGDFLLRS